MIRFALRVSYRRAESGLEIEDPMDLDQITQQGIRWAEQGRPSEALACWGQVVEFADEIGYDDAVATAFLNMGLLLMKYKGSNDRATEAFRQAMSYTDDPERLAVIKINLGVLATRKAPPDWDAARDHFDFAAEHGVGPTQRQAMQYLARLAT